MTNPVTMMDTREATMDKQQRTSGFLNWAAIGLLALTVIIVVMLVLTGQLG